MRECTSKAVLREIKVVKILAGGNVKRETLINEVIIEGNGREVVEAAEEGRKRASYVGVGEVDGRDRVGNRVAANAEPGARGGVAVGPGRESGVRVRERELHLVEIEAFLVERKGRGRKEKGKERKEKEKHSC